MTFEESNVRETIPAEILPFLKQRPELTIFETKQQPPPTSKMMNLYHCDVCPFETHSAGAFQSHMEGHKPYKTHDCQTCGKGFKTAGRLHAHMQTHEPGQPFVCVYCEKKFKHNSSLRTHMKIHLGIDIHCPMCDKTFNNNAAMKKHLAVQHQMDDFQK
ncbi:gastrula zinc finger protein XlCGF32.1-like [Uloborus diversus]|uniref:gastrula zinc finger protein XlCGF32.1-like n=1 Tax=Uloborus diversus TaxID=327109 RepID=UPI0024099569|nr:gastrula zinc finger protein XlCGF32.1-like [Uloborus diversus]